ncbi:MAG: dTDP-4-dehydrorhamnose 3,5-epimerase [Vicinamibacteraceae bacterium]|nr:dTDP-4-dehydrorhamnose 3,5-epimerase [Vicinamibacteraceae bacterium]
MRVHETALEGVVLVEPTVWRDARGFFVETWHAARYREAGLDVPFVQDNHSRSVEGTLRGLHWQEGRPQGKLVRVIEGSILDVAVDIRPQSPTFGHHVAVTLSADNFLQCYIPPGFAHGFYVTSPVAQVEYKCTDYYAPEEERGLLWSDPDVGIVWPSPSPLLSARDRQHPTLRELFGQGPAPRTRQVSALER